MENKNPDETINTSETAALSGAEYPVSAPPSRTLMVGLITVAAFLTPFFAYIAYEAIFNVFEKTPPLIILKDTPRAIGSIPVRFSFLIKDDGAGVQSYTVRIIQGQTAKIIESTELPGVESIEKSVILDAEKANLKDGDAIIEIRANDDARKKNEVVVSQKITIDQEKPEISLFLAPESMMSGEATLIAVQVKESSLISLSIKSDFRSFPLLKASRLDPELADDLYVAMVTFLDPVRVVAEDFAGNISARNLPYTSIKKGFTEIFIATDREGDNSQGYERLKKNDDLQLSDIFQKYADTKLKSLEFPKEPLKTPLLFSYKDIIKYGASSLGASDGVFYKSFAQDERASVVLPGEVVFQGEMPFYGNSVLVNHGLGIFSFYANLKESIVKNGQSLKKGDVIGFIGESSSYAATGLYLAVFVSGTPMDPNQFLNTQSFIKALPKKIGAIKKKLGISVVSPMEK